MGSAKISDWIQIIGIFALVASLIFVGLQMKQSQDCNCRPTSGPHSLYH